MHLTRLSGLEGLDLHETRVTDAGLSHLKGLSRLRDLLLDDTYVTSAGVATLREALPDVSVEGFAPPVGR